MCNGVDSGRTCNTKVIPHAGRKEPHLQERSKNLTGSRTVSHSFCTCDPGAWCCSETKRATEAVNLPDEHGVEPSPVSIGHELV